MLEIHDGEQLPRALVWTEQHPRHVRLGINNRNLKTFEVDLSSTEKLSQEVGPYHILVSESGIYTGEDTAKIQSWGADAILVGEALMRAEDRTAKVAELKGIEA